MQFGVKTVLGSELLKHVCGADIATLDAQAL